MHRTNLKYLPALAISFVVLFGISAAQAQTPNAWGYSTGYGNVYGTFGLAQTMQTMYNTTFSFMLNGEKRKTYSYSAVNANGELVP